MGIGGLGDIALYKGDNRNMLYVIFVFATFATNILFLNMLINVMGDTLDRLKEQRERIGIEQRTYLFADFIDNFLLDQRFENSQYVYIIEPLSSNVDLDD